MGTTSHPSSSHDKHDFVVHVADTTRKIVVGGTGAIKQASKIITSGVGTLAFRRTGKVNGLLVPLLNKSGNLRGQVINYKARVVHGISFNVAKKFAKFFPLVTLGGVIYDLAKHTDEIRDINHGNLSRAQKNQKIALITMVSIVKTLTSVVPVAGDLVGLGAQAAVRLVDVATSGQFHETLQGTSARIDAGNIRVHTFHDNFEAGDAEHYLHDAYHWYDTHIDIQ